MDAKLSKDQQILIEKNLGGIYRFALHYLNLRKHRTPGLEAGDLVNDAVLALIPQIRHYRPDHAFLTWAKRPIWQSFERSYWSSRCCMDMTRRLLDRVPEILNQWGETYFPTREQLKRHFGMQIIGEPHYRRLYLAWAQAARKPRTVGNQSHTGMRVC